MKSDCESMMQLVICMQRRIRTTNIVLQSIKCNMDDSPNDAGRSDDDAFFKVCEYLLAKKSRVWNAVELAELSRTLLLERSSAGLSP